MPDKQGEATILKADIRSEMLAEDSIVTFTCLVPGTGKRFALDSDLDGILNRDEVTTL